MVMLKDNRQGSASKGRILKLDASMFLEQQEALSVSEVKVCFVDSEIVLILGCFWKVISGLLSFYAWDEIHCTRILL